MSEAMTDELRAAAERLRSGEVRVDDLHELAKAHLAEHPADDDEPVTVPWLLDCGFHPVGGELWFNPITRRSNGTWELCDEFRMVTPQTRGNLRRLCNELGIELKEQK